MLQTKLSAKTHGAETAAEIYESLLVASLSTTDRFVFESFHNPKETVCDVLASTSRNFRQKRCSSSLQFQFTNKRHWKTKTTSQRPEQNSVQMGLFTGRETRDQRLKCGRSGGVVFPATCLERPGARDRYRGLVCSGPMCPQSGGAATKRLRVPPKAPEFRSAAYVWLWHSREASSKALFLELRAENFQSSPSH